MKQRLHKETPLCAECGGELETLTASVSEDCTQYISAVKCTKCGHTSTLRTKRLGAQRNVDMIV